MVIDAMAPNRMPTMASSMNGQSLADGFAQQLQARVDYEKAVRLQSAGPRNSRMTEFECFAPCAPPGQSWRRLRLVSVSSIT